MLTQGEAFAATYQSTWAQLDSARKLHFRMWCWLPHGRTKIELVFEGLRGSAPLFRDGVRISENVRRYGQWELIEQDFVLPADMEDADYIRMFLWQQAPIAENSYFDDISLEKLK